jgi:hypothetical protein
MYYKTFSGPYAGFRLNLEGRKWREKQVMKRSSVHFKVQTPLQIVLIKFENCRSPLKMKLCTMRCRNY